MNRKPARWIVPVRGSLVFGLALVFLTAGLPPARTQPAQTIALPDLMAVELPAGGAKLAPTDPPLRDLLASSTSGRLRVTTDLRRQLGAGAARVTWSAWNGEPETGTPAAMRTATVFVLPAGMTQAGVSGDENATAGNNAVHIARDRNGRVHMVWVDSGRAAKDTGPIYRRGVIGEDGTARFETPPMHVAEGTPEDWTAYPGLAVDQDAVYVVWQGGGKAWTRRLNLGPSGYVWGPPRDTGARSDGRDSGPSIAADGNRVHIITPSGVYAFSSDGGQSWMTAPMPIPPGQRLKTASLALDSAGSTIAFSSLVRDPKDDGKNEGSGGYWQLRIIQRTSDGRWLGASDALGEFPAWGEPFPGQDVLADWARVGVDRARGIHLLWHGTAASHIYGHDQAYYAYRPAGGDWRPPVTLVAPDSARGIKFSFAPSMTLDGEGAWATVFHDVYSGERWAGFDAVLVPLWDGLPTAAALPVTQFVRESIDRNAPEFALSSRFPAAAPAAFRGTDGRTRLDILETLIPMGVPDSPKLIVWHRLDVSDVVKH
jgi:hypothetical protein